MRPSATAASTESWRRSSVTPRQLCLYESAPRLRDQLGVPLSQRSLLRSRSDGAKMQHAALKQPPHRRQPLCDMPRVFVKGPAPTEDRSERLLSALVLERGIDTLLGWGAGMSSLICGGGRCTSGAAEQQHTDGVSLPTLTGRPSGISPSASNCCSKFAACC